MESIPVSRNTFVDAEAALHGRSELDKPLEDGRTVTRQAELDTVHGPRAETCGQPSYR